MGKDASKLQQVRPLASVQTSVARFACHLFSTEFSDTNRRKVVVLFKNDKFNLSRVNFVTLGVVSNVGTYPQVETKEQEDLLSAGPMCRFAEDLIPLLKVIAGKNADFLNLDSKVDITKLKVTPSSYS